MLFSTAATWSDSAPSRRLFYNNPVRRKRNDTSCSAFRCRDGVRRRSTQKRHRLSVVPLERATRISPKRRLRRIQRGEIEEAAGELPTKAGKATIAATVCADGARKMKWSGRRGSNSLPPPWQGGALPDELRPQWCLRPGSDRRHADFQSAALPAELPRHIKPLLQPDKWRPGRDSNPRPPA